MRKNPVKGTQVNHAPDFRSAESLIGDFNRRNKVGNEPGIRLPTSEHEAVTAAQRARGAALPRHVAAQGFWKGQSMHMIAQLR